MKLRKKEKLRAIVSRPKRKTFTATGAKQSPHKKGLPPPKGFATWLDYAVRTLSMSTRGLYLDHCRGYQPQWPTGVQRSDFEAAAIAELAVLRARARNKSFPVKVLKKRTSKKRQGDIDRLLKTFQSKANILITRDTIADANLKKWDPYEGGRQAVDALTRAEGGAVTRQEATRKLGIKLTTLYNRIRNKEVVVWTDASGHFHFPRWQFRANGLLPGITECLKILDSFDYWAVMKFFLTHSEAGDASPLTLLRNGNVEAAKSIAANASVRAGN